MKESVPGKPSVNHGDWQRLTPRQKDAFVHQHLMGDTGDPPPYTTDYDTARLVETRYSVLYQLDEPMKYADGNRHWFTRAYRRTDSPSNDGGYTEHAPTAAEAVRCAILSA